MAPEGSTQTSISESSYWDFLRSPISPISNNPSLDELFETHRLHLTISPLDMFQPTLKINTNLTYRPVSPEADQLMSPTQIDGGPRDMRVSCHYAHPRELDTADPANLKGFASSPVSPMSSISFQLTDWIEAGSFDLPIQQAAPQELQPDHIFNPALTDVETFRPEFTFPAPTHGIFPTFDAMLQSASEEPPMEGLKGNPFMGAPRGSVFDEVFPISRPPIKTVPSHPRPRPIPRAVHNFVDTELPTLNFTFIPEVDLGKPWVDTFSFLQQQDLPTANESIPEPSSTRGAKTRGESDTGDGSDFPAGWPNVDDFELAFPTPPSSHGTEGSNRTPPTRSTPVSEQPKNKRNDQWLLAGALRQQAAARPTSQASLDRLKRLRDEYRVVREKEAGRIREKVALHHARRARAQAQLPHLEIPRTVLQHFALRSPRVPPPLPGRSQPWQFGPLAREHPTAVTHRPVPPQHLQMMPPANDWKTGFRVPAHDDRGVVWYQVTSAANGDVLGYQPRHEPVPPSFGTVPNPPAVIPRQTPPRQGPVLLVPAKMPAGASPKRPANQSKGNPKKIVLIDGIAYQRL